MSLDRYAFPSVKPEIKDEIFSVKTTLDLGYKLNYLGQKMDANDFVHTDLKTPNIMYNPPPDGMSFSGNVAFENQISYLPVNTKKLALGGVVQIIDIDFLQDLSGRPEVFGTGYFLELPNVEAVYRPLEDGAPAGGYTKRYASSGDDLYAIGISVLLNLPLYKGKFSKLPSVMVDLHTNQTDSSMMLSDYIIPEYGPVSPQQIQKQGQFQYLTHFIYYEGMNPFLPQSGAGFRPDMEPLETPQPEKDMTRLAYSKLYAEPSITMSYCPIVVDNALLLQPKSIPDKLDLQNVVDNTDINGIVNTADIVKYNRERNLKVVSCSRVRFDSVDISLSNATL